MFGRNPSPWDHHSFLWSMVVGALSSGDVSPQQVNCSGWVEPNTQEHKNKICSSLSDTGAEIRGGASLFHRSASWSGPPAKVTPRTRTCKKPSVPVPLHPVRPSGFLELPFQFQKMLQWVQTGFSTDTESCTEQLLWVYCARCNKITQVFKRLVCLTAD